MEHGLVLALRVAVRLLTKMSQAPYHGTTDWEQLSRKTMIEAAAALCTIESMLHESELKGEIARGPIVSGASGDHVVPNINASWIQIFALGESGKQ